MIAACSSSSTAFRPHNMRRDAVLPSRAAASASACAEPDLAEAIASSLRAQAVEVEESTQLGYVPCSGNSRGWKGVVSSWRLPRAALGFGAHYPFGEAEGGLPSEGEEDLVFVTESPCFTADELAAVRSEAAAFIESGGGSSFSLTDTNRDANVHDLPRALGWLNSVALPRLVPLVSHCLLGGTDTELYVYRALVVQYDAAAGLASQPVHRDGALVSLTVPLSASAEYEGGGTHIEPLRRAIVVERGQVLLHPSAVRHGGARITAGERWVLVVFLSPTDARFCEHGRRIKAAAASAGDEGDPDEELRLLRLAAESFPDDHELWYDAAVCLHNAGRVEEAVALYLKAAALNEADAQLTSNLGAAYLELGDHRAAFRWLRASLDADFSVNAALMAVDLLLCVDRRAGAAAVLRRVPAHLATDDAIEAAREEVGAG